MGAYSHNVKVFFHSKPPLVMFLLSILSFSLTMLFLALYIQNNTSIKNTDVLDWNRLMQEMAVHQFCLCEKEVERVHIEAVPAVVRRRRELIQNINRADLNNSIKIVATEKLPIKSRLVDQLKLNTTFRGVAVIPLDHFGLGHDASASVKVTLQQEQDNQQLVCVTVEGDWEHVQGLVNGTVGIAQCASSPVITQNLCVRSASHVPHFWCGNGIRFEMDFDDQPQYITYLTPQDRSLVHLHLISTSAFLAAIFLVIVGVAGLRGASIKKGEAAWRALNKDCQNRPKETP